MVARLASIAKRHQKVAGSSPAVVITFGEHCMSHKFHIYNLQSYIDDTSVKPFFLRPSD